MRFWTADLHLGHINALRFYRRPFSTVEEMDSEICKRWRDVVKEQDTVMLLGDICIGSLEKTLPMLASLPGRKLLLPGNRDKCSKVFWRGKKVEYEESCKLFESYEIEIIEPTIVTLSNKAMVQISHYPYGYDPLYSSHRPVDWGLPLLHGHIHNDRKILNNQVNVGVDVNNFTPVSEDEICNILENLGSKIG